MSEEGEGHNGTENGSDSQGLEALEQAWRDLDSTLGLSDMLPSDDAHDRAIQGQLVGMLGSYLKANNLIPPAGEKLQVDGNFVTQHAGPLIMHLMNGVMSAIMNVDDPHDTAPTESAPNVTLDFTSLFGSLLAADDEDDAAQAPADDADAN